MEFKDKWERNLFASEVVHKLKDVDDKGLMALICALTEELIDRDEGKTRAVVEGLDFLIHEMIRRYGIEDTEDLG